MATKKQTEISAVVRHVTQVSGYPEMSSQLQSDLIVLAFHDCCSYAAVLTSDVEAARKAASLPPHKALAQYLSTQTTGKAPTYVKQVSGYSLELSRQEFLRTQYFGRAAARKLATDIRALFSSISDEEMKGYCEECCRCFEHQLFRASIVMAWCAAFHAITGWTFRKWLSAFNTHATTWKDPKTISTAEQFDDLRESQILDTLKVIGAITKAEHGRLKRLLDERNQYAHPSGTAINSAIAEAYLTRVIEDVIRKYI